MEPWNLRLKLFRKDNNITQTELGEYLGVGRQFICAIERGKCDMPKDKYDKLMKNDQGWNMTALTRDSNNTSISANASSHSKASINIGSRIALEEHLAALQERISELERERDRYWTIIQKLLNKQL